MNFAQWFENEQVYPESRKYYFACVLSEHWREYLRGFVERKMGSFIPENWVFKTHHMTVKFNVTIDDFKKYQNLFGKGVDMQVQALGWDKDCIAAVVKAQVPSDNPIPHITVAHSPMVKPFYSNQMLQDNIKPETADTEVISSIFCAVAKWDEDDIWPVEAKKLLTT